MKSEIYCFSGSGNSLNIAQGLSKKMQNATLHSIPKVMEETREVEGEIIGIVCPIYYHNTPHIVMDFIKRIKKAQYLFMVYAGAGELGAGHRGIRKAFSNLGLGLSALFNIPMPDNSTKYEETEEQRRKVLAEAERRILEIVPLVEGRKEHFDSSNTRWFQSYVYPGLLNKYLYSITKKLDGDFSVDVNCTGCSTCQRVCPVNNIRMKEGKPTWKNCGQCETCLACHDWCPRGAIKSVHTEDHVKRYHHPQVSVKDMIGVTARSDRGTEGK